MTHVNSGTLALLLPILGLGLGLGLGPSLGCAADEAERDYQAGEDLPSAAIGDASVGAQVFIDKSCESCHSYGGVGGTDAPALDFMAGKLSATDIANMSGTTWNHLPQMLVFFEAEGIPVPTFADQEMPDLLAHLHGDDLEHDGSETDYVAGDDLPAAAIGDALLGEQIFSAKNCGDCHSYAGAGGDDAPALDFMTGKLSANQVAAMSGTIWNHVPQMLGYFQAEGIPVPTFEGDEMADLLAYLHGGSAA